MRKAQDLDEPIGLQTEDEQIWQELAVLLCTHDGGVGFGTIATLTKVPPSQLERCINLLASIGVIAWNGLEVNTPDTSQVFHSGRKRYPSDAAERTRERKRRSRANIKATRDKVKSHEVTVKVANVTTRDLYQVTSENEQFFTESISEFDAIALNALPTSRDITTTIFTFPVSEEAKKRLSQLHCSSDLMRTTTTRAGAHAQARAHANTTQEEIVQAPNGDPDAEENVALSTAMAYWTYCTSDTVTRLQGDQLDAMLQRGIPLSDIMNAMKETAEKARPRTWAYCKAIIERWAAGDAQAQNQRQVAPGGWRNSWKQPADPKAAAMAANQAQGIAVHPSTYDDLEHIGYTYGDAGTA